MGFHCHLSSSVSFTEYPSIQGLIPVLRIIITIVLSGKDGKRRKHVVVKFLGSEGAFEFNDDVNDYYGYQLFRYKAL
jgi:hypothetical protein